MSFTNPSALLLLSLIPILLLIASPWPKKAWRYGFTRFGGRQIASLIVRSLIILLIVLALAGLQRVQSADNLATLFVLDMSDSISPTAQETAQAYIREALASMGPRDRGGLVVFGNDALVERTASNSPVLRPISSVPNPSYSNLAGGINLALAAFPNDAAKRIVVLSDGAANVGDARQAAQIAAASGAEVSVVKLTNESGVEVRLTDLNAPSLLREGEQFDLTVQLHSTTPMSVPIQIFSEGRLVAQNTLRLQSGRQTFAIPQVAGSTGFSTFRAVIFPPEDSFPENNQLETFSEIEGPAKLLLVAQNPTEGQPLLQALQTTGLQISQVDPSGLPTDLRQLSEYDALILVNLPSFKLAPRQLELLQTYVRDLGGGLVVVGGEESYGPGGYFQTPLEATLPVNMTITDTKRLPGMTILMVIDKSGSMTDGGSMAGGPRKIELAKEAIYRSIDLLVPWDRIGVVAFDNAAYWVQKPVNADPIKPIKDAVGTLRASGGTDILAGLEVAAEAILKETTQVRHIILLTDGGADPTGIPELTQKLADVGVTVSVVAIGAGYAPFLEEVAEIGGGRFHFADDASVIPQIFAQETSLATRSYVVEETFTPKMTASSPILEGLTSMPPLHGYVATSSKLTARTILVGGEKADPLLVEWQYGLGRAVAWTSDAKGQWAADWITWPEFPKFWSQVVRSTLVEGATGGIESYIELQGEEAIIKAEILDSQGRYRNNLSTTLSLVDPEMNQQTINLAQTAPGLYEGSFRPSEKGTYFLRLVGQEDDQIVAAQTRGFVMAYSPEYRLTEPDPTLLDNLYQIGQGRDLTAEAPAVAFSHTLPPARAATDLWPWLLLVAVLLLPLDVGLRRVMFGREDIRLLWAKIRGRLPERAMSQPVASNTGQLLKAKQRVTGKQPSSSQLGRASKSANPTKSSPASTTKAEPTDTSDSADDETIQRLLRAKRRKRR